MRNISSKENVAIENHIKDRIGTYILPYAARLHKYRLNHEPGLLELYGQESDDNSNVAIMLRVAVFHQFKQTHIPNVFMPSCLRHSGVGKGLIREVYMASRERGYETFVVQMTEGFMRRLINRGAAVSDADTVQILARTDLSHRASNSNH